MKVKLNFKSCFLYKLNEIISLKLGTQTESAGVMSYARHIFFNQYRHSVNALTLTFNTNDSYA